MNDELNPALLMPVVRRLRLAPGMPRTPDDVVLPREQLATWQEGMELLQSMRAAGQEEVEAMRLAAQVEAEAIRAAAYDDADAVRAAAADDALALKQEASQMVWREAHALLEELRGQRAALQTEAGRMLARLARTALRRLLLEVPPGWPAVSSVRLVLREWRAAAGTSQAVLRVHAQDYDSLPAELRSGDAWQSVADASVASGTCVLTAGGSELSANFSASVSSLVAALGRHAGDISEEAQ
ncbi:HrpE/YscL family type III secretion apparatus protein [Pseudoduganella sp. R-34]|uniref:FliH/SctL family protein n=1 Tax=unclassified Pseudoduganella TaxID=2637179 RepID=UPI003CFAC412